MELTLRYGETKLCRTAPDYTGWREWAEILLQELANWLVSSVTALSDLIFEITPETVNLVLSRWQCGRNQNAEVRRLAMSLPAPSTTPTPTPTSTYPYSKKLCVFFSAATYSVNGDNTPITINPQWR
jgi:hypothetical protein